MGRRIGGVHYVHASPGGAGPPVCGSQTPAEMFPPDARRGGRRQLNIPLKLPERSLTAITASSSRKTWETPGTTGSCSGCYSSHFWSKHSLDKMQREKLRQEECFFEIDWPTRKVSSAKMSVPSSSWILKRVKWAPPRIKFFLHWWFDTKWDGKDIHSHHFRKRGKWSTHEILKPENLYSESLAL